MHHNGVASRRICRLIHCGRSLAYRERLVVARRLYHRDKGENHRGRGASDGPGTETRHKRRTRLGHYLHEAVFKAGGYLDAVCVGLGHHFEHLALGFEVGGKIAGGEKLGEGFRFLRRGRTVVKTVEQAANF